MAFTSVWTQQWDPKETYNYRHYLVFHLHQKDIILDWDSFVFFPENCIILWQDKDFLISKVKWAAKRISYLCYPSNISRKMTFVQNNGTFCPRSMPMHLLFANETYFCHIKYFPRLIIMFNFLLFLEKLTKEIVANWMFLISLRMKPFQVPKIDNMAGITALVISLKTFTTYVSVAWIVIREKKA